MALTDHRLVGETAENVFLSLLNSRGVFAASLDTAGFDGVVFDTEKQFFKTGESPFYVQIKCRGSKGKRFSTQGHSTDTIEKIRQVAQELQIPQSSVYFVV